jgi:hypothetical protein
MAQYRLEAKVIRRADGRSATAAAAYRSGSCIRDSRTGQTFDYSHRRGVMHSRLVMPMNVNRWRQTGDDRAEFWNEIELHNKRKDSVVARELILNLPFELPSAAQVELAEKFSRHIADRYQIAVDCCIHEPKKQEVGDPRNVHAHLLLSTNTLTDSGIGKKCRSLDAVAMQRHVDERNQIDLLREEWCDMQNRYLSLHCSQIQPVSHLSYADRGIEKIPSLHLGPSETAHQRKEKNKDKASSNSIIIFNKLASELNSQDGSPSEIQKEIELLEIGLRDLYDENVVTTEDARSSEAVERFKDLYSEVNALSGDRHEAKVLLVAAKLESMSMQYFYRPELDSIKRRKRPANDDDLLMLAAAIAEAARRLLNVILRSLGMHEIAPFGFSNQVTTHASRLLNQDAHVLALTKVALYASFVVENPNSRAGMAWRNVLNSSYQRVPVTEHRGIRDDSLIGFCISGLLAADQIQEEDALLLGDVSSSNKLHARDMAIESLKEITLSLRTYEEAATRQIMRLQAALRRLFWSHADMHPTQVRSELLTQMQELKWAADRLNSSSDMATRGADVNRARN